MTSIELGKFRRGLVKLARRLGHESSHLREEALGEERKPEINTAAEQFTDDDLSRESADEEVALGMLGNEEGLLAECLAALDRIERGTFGKCLSCGKAIAKVRLDVAPYARNCIHCARETEKPRA
jgi:RNA polymerase-binding transcription factor DksA